MKIQNIPKKCSYKNILFWSIIAIIVTYISHSLAHSQEIVVLFRYDAQLAETFMAKILPISVFAFLIIYAFCVFDKRQALKKTENIKSVVIEKSGISFNHYDVTKNFSITEDELIDLEIIMNIFERIRRITRSRRSSFLFPDPNNKETIIDEIELVFTLSDGQEFKIINSPQVPLDFIYQIFENFNDISKIKHSYNGKGNTKIIEKDINYFIENGTRRLLIDELGYLITPFAIAIIFIVFILVNHFGS